MNIQKQTYIANDKYANKLGIELVNVEKEYARCELKINDNHRNGLGSIHGAVVFALADITFAAACKKKVLKFLKDMQCQIMFMYV